MITMIICAKQSAGMTCGARLEFAQDSGTGAYTVRSVAKLAKPPHTLLYASSSACVYVSVLTVCTLSEP